jgi:bifunctional DNase/RNase
MTPMRIRALLSSPDNDRAVIMLEDAEQRRRLAFSADLQATQRLGRALGNGKCVCHPIYDFVDPLLGVLQARITDVVLDDAGDLGIGAVIELEHAGMRLGIPCYPPDAIAVAVRAKVPST